MTSLENTTAHFYYRQWFSTPPALPVDLNLSGKTAIITELNTGLGYSAAEQLLSHGLSTLILGVRTASKGEAAKSTLLPYIKAKHPQLPVPKILVWHLNMTSYKFVLAFANKVESSGLHIDISILNAGHAPLNFTLSPDGNESAIQVNFLSTALSATKLRYTMNKTYHAALARREMVDKQPVLSIVGSAAMNNAEALELDAAKEKGTSILEELR